MPTTEYGVESEVGSAYVGKFAYPYVSSICVGYHCMLKHTV